MSTRNKVTNSATGDKSTGRKGESVRRRQVDPAPQPGLGRGAFRRICDNGFGDGHNSFAHSVSWFDGKLYVGTTRSNFQMIKIQKIFSSLPVHLWPVDGPEDTEGLYALDRRAQIWSYDSNGDRWEQVFAAPMVEGAGGDPVARETGFRTMTVFQGESDPGPALYAATWAVSRAPGSLILRSTDGRNFAPVSDYGIIPGTNVTATRVLVPFKDRLFTSPTGTRGYNVKFVINVSGLPFIYESRDPAKSDWNVVCEPGFGEETNKGIFMLCPFNDQLYAGTMNNEGLQLWRSACEGNPPYRWVKVMEQGGYRGPLNQAVVSMASFNGALYIGTGIQNGGFDFTNNIGPAGAEILRILPDDTWEIMVGSPRETPVGKKYPLSGLQPGFGNIFNGYLWSLVEHDGWLYAGTMDSTIWLQWLKRDSYADHARKFVDGVGVENILENEAGCDLWRSADGENWLPVTRTGFDNKYNLGIRNLASTPVGLFCAVANPFGPRVAVEQDGEWGYVDNPRGGLEIWRASHDGHER